LRAVATDIFIPVQIDSVPDLPGKGSGIASWPSVALRDFACHLTDDGTGSQRITHHCASVAARPAGGEHRQEPLGATAVHEAVLVDEGPEPVWSGRYRAESLMRESLRQEGVRLSGQRPLIGDRKPAEIGRRAPEPGGGHLRIDVPAT